MCSWAGIHEYLVVSPYPDTHLFPQPRKRLHHRKLLVPPVHLLRSVGNPHRRFLAFPFPIIVPQPHHFCPLHRSLDAIIFRPRKRHLGSRHRGLASQFGVFGFESEQQRRRWGIFQDRGRTMAKPQSPWFHKIGFGEHEKLGCCELVEEGVECRQSQRDSFLVGDEFRVSEGVR